MRMWRVQGGGQWAISLEGLGKFPCKTEKQMNSVFISCNWLSPECCRIRTVTNGDICKHGKEKGKRKSCLVINGKVWTRTNVGSGLFNSLQCLAEWILYNIRNHS